jgi:hypothetical protein
MNDKPTIFLDMDGVLANFVKGYKDAFDRDAYADDPFTIKQFCNSKPDFFRHLPVLDKGRELFELLKDDYKIVILTTPMDGMVFCKQDKVSWMRENFGNYDIIFTADKADYATDESSILIDDMDYNLKPFADAGGTAIDFNKNNIQQIMEKIETVIYGKEEIAEVKKQLENMVVNTKPTEKEKESGLYKKGKIQFKGMNILIENTPGSIRFGWSEDGQKWVSRMKHYYGYIQGTEGADYDPVDCFIGNRLNASRAFVINQGKQGLFDEVKIILGVDNIEDARKLYLSNYSKGQDKNIMSIIPTNCKKIREWLKLNSKDPYV